MNSLTTKIPRLHLYVFTVLVILILIQSGLRVIFWLQFNDASDPVSGSDLLWAFYLGSRFDMQVAMGALLPLFLVGWIKPLHPLYSTFGRNLWLLYIALVITAIYIFHITDAGHYAYLEQRLNATALRFLENPMISATMVWQTYPVITGAIILMVTVAASSYLVKYLTGRIDTSDSTRNYWLQKRWYSKTLLSVGTFFLVLFTLMAKPPDSTSSWYPLRWSDAFFSTHAFSSQVASNPIIYFSNTLKNVAETYDLEATRAAYPRMVEYLGIQQPDADKLNFRRDYRYAASGKSASNVVVIILESFASYKTSLSANPLDTTPHIRWLADNGLFFPNFFTPSTGTARSVWTFVTGIPDIEKNKTSSRNPLIVDQHTIINAFEDHEKLYFLGGSASWANIRGLLSSNIPGLKLYEEGSYQEPDVDVWGISDLSLFREANQVLEKQQGPFFAIIQTSGNHRPYTIPDDNEGFEMWTDEDVPGDVADYGFHSLEEMNSFRFMDHSLGHFLKLARESSYFDDTLFVLFGDHGIHAPAGKHTPAYETQLRLHGLRVPLVFYGKNIIEQTGTFATIASETDVLPTIASLTRTSYTNTTLGRDLTDQTLAAQRYAFTVEHAGSRTIGLLDEDYYLQMLSDGSNVRLHDLNSEDARQNKLESEKVLADEMTATLSAIWQSIRYIRENNAPKSTPGKPPGMAPGSGPESVPVSASGAKSPD